MAMQQQQDQNDSMNFKRNFNIAYMACLIHQRALVVPFRNQFGTQALGAPCGLAFVLMLLWAAFSRDPFMWMWTLMWLICFIRRRVEALRLAKSGQRIHSQYDGWPWDAIRIGRTEKAAKLVVEPLLVGILGALLYWIYSLAAMSPYGLPYFLLSGIFTLPLVESVKHTILQRRTQSMLDAQLDQEQVMQDFRDRYGDN